MAKSRCGTDCSECQHMKSGECNGCGSEGTAFWCDGCPAKFCCESKNLSQCCECVDFPCQLLKDWGYK